MTPHHMYTHELDDADRYDRIGAIDIETTGLTPTTNSLVAIATGYYDTTTTEFEWTVHTRARTNDEPALIHEAFAWLASYQLDGIITFNGTNFDLPFITHRLNAHEIRDGPEVPGRHVDLYPPRKRAADEANEKWPSLEECLAAYDIPRDETTYNGARLDNTRFGEELAPAYLDAIAARDDHAIQELESIITPYAGADIEATIALYEADAGRTYTPSYSFD